ncbi:MAG: winged helix-turn-helix transcriptional regulator, partial [Candidatus Thorarchaeota archaeon]
MDLIDKGIILDLDRNCRVSYEILARRYNLAANSIKRRIEKLLESGVIQRFTIELSLAMMDSELMLALISTEGLEDEKAFLEKIAENPMVLQVGFLPSGNSAVFAEYVGSQGLSDLGLFFRGLEGVKEVEMHTLLIERGGKVELTTLRLKVLRCLVQDARMPISEIAEQTGLTAKRVRKVLDQFLDNEVVRFTIRANLNAGEDTAF